MWQLVFLWGVNTYFGANDAFSGMKKINSTINNVIDFDSIKI